MSKNFSKDLAELEAIVAWFESDSLDLDEALVKFERGMELANTLKDYLVNVENKVTKIKQKFDQKNPQPEAAPEPEPEPEEVADENDSLALFS